MSTDKLAHFCLGILIAGAFLMLAGPLAAVLVTAAAAVGKEAYGNPPIFNGAQK